MIILAILFIKEIRERGPLNFSIILQAGHYTVKCYGAQGGSSSANGNKLKSGGKGSYATGTMTIKGAGTTFWAYVGGKGLSSQEGPNLGGYNGGGRGGKDYGGVYPGGNDASGGGGGATDLRIDDNSIESRIIVAAGGSGAAYSSDGAPGGDITGYYASSNDVFKLSDEVDQTKGIITGLGGDGLSANFVTGSGGGGGWRGGTSTNDFAILNKSSYKAVSHSGSSYISGYSILTCIDNFYFYENKCYAACPPNITIAIDTNKTCIKCQDQCKTCSSSTDHCTSCSEGYYLFGNACIQECSHLNDQENGIYYGKNNEKQECSVCNDNNCIDCSENYLICKECSPYYHINNGICVQDPPCELYEDESFYLLDKCDYTEKEVKYAYIYVLLAKFTKQINNDDNGGAVHIIDCGIQCNDTCFIDCISPSGCGGAIYVNNSFNMINNATFVNVLFLRCKALAGGAVFVYEKSTLYNISFVE